MVVADGEVAALDDGVAEIAREIGVAEVGRARPAPGSGSRSGRRRAGTAPGSSPAGPGSSRRAAGCGSRGTARPGRGSAPRGWPGRSRCRSRCRSGRRAPPSRRSPCGRRRRHRRRESGAAAPSRSTLVRTKAGLPSSSDAGSAAVAQERLRRRAGRASTASISRARCRMPAARRSHSPSRQQHRHEVEAPGMRPVVGIGIDVEGDAALAQQPARALARRRAPFGPSAANPSTNTRQCGRMVPSRRQHLVEGRCRRGVAGQQAVEVGELVRRVGQRREPAGWHSAADPPQRWGCRKRRTQVHGLDAGATSARRQSDAQLRPSRHHATMAAPSSNASASHAGSMGVSFIPSTR